MRNGNQFSYVQANAMSVCSVPALRFSPHSVVLVSDRLDDFQHLQNSLREQLFDVIAVSDGWEAYYHTQTLSSLVLLIDMEMESFDSLTLCRLVRHAGLMPRVGIILATRKNSSCLRIAALELGVLDVLILPLDPDELMWRVVMHKRTVLRQCDATPECGLKEAAAAQGSSVVKAVMRLVEREGYVLGKIASLARAVGVNRRRLAMVFKNETGEPLASYLRRKKIETACHLLIATTMPVKEVANYIGFISSCNFTVAFQRSMGISPSEYRKKNGKPWERRCCFQASCERQHGIVHNPVLA